MRTPTQKSVETSQTTATSISTTTITSKKLVLESEKQNIIATDDDSQEFHFVGDDRTTPDSIYVNLETSAGDYGDVGNEHTDDDDDDHNHDHDNDNGDIEEQDGVEDVYMTEEMTEDEEILGDVPFSTDIEDKNQKSLQDLTDTPKQKRGRGRPKKNVTTTTSVLVEQNDLASNNTVKCVERKASRTPIYTSRGDSKTSQGRRRRLAPGDERSPKICDICGNSYKYQHALNAHMRRHNNVRPFACEFCEKSFVACVELQRHMRVHTGQKPYACQYCDRRFSDFGSRIKHERTHTGERPYRCETCHKSFAYAHVLSVHLRTHTGEKRFPCMRCGKGFTKKAYLLTHQSQHGRCTYVPSEENGEYEDSKPKSMQQDDSAFTTEYFVEEVHMKYEDGEAFSNGEGDVDNNEQLVIAKNEVYEADEDNMAEEHLVDDDDGDGDIVFEIHT